MKKLTFKEKDVQTQIINLLVSTGFEVIRLNGGSFGSTYTNKDGKTKTRRISTYWWASAHKFSGVPDLMAFRNGKTLFIECKRTVGGVLSPDQALFKHRFETKGFKVLVANKFDDVLAEISKPEYDAKLFKF